MRRTGLDRHSLIADTGGDPLDGLVNLFDVGIVLAVAFLIAGLGLTANPEVAARESDASTAPGGERTIARPEGAPRASGRGREVGRVFRLPDGRLVLVEDGNEADSR